MEHAFALAENLVLPLTAILTVWVVDLLKRVNKVDGMPAPAKTILAVFVAYGLVQLGQLTQTALPETLHAFGESDVEALLTAAMAFGIHAAKKKTGYRSVR